jgi:hypothetical protein
MALPSGTITLAEVNAEIGASPTAAINLNQDTVRRLAATATLSPTSPFLTTNTQISMNDLRGRVAAVFASGGTVITTPTRKIHVFTSPGTFTVNYAFPTSTIDYMVVAGGGAGGRPNLGPGSSGGGGAGGYRTGTGFSVNASPGSYPITVGGGGSVPSSNGSPSTFSTITSTGGGAGSRITSIFFTFSTAGSGGSGGGSFFTPTLGSGNTPPVTPPQGNPGGVGSFRGPNSPPFVSTIGGGGGGAGAAGNFGPGGIGQQLPWSPDSYGEAPPTAPADRFFAGGGGGSGSSGNGDGGLGGGGDGSQYGGGTGDANSGGGGGSNANGGSGIVMISYLIA